MIGAKSDSDGGTDSGSAYIFERNQGGTNNWGQVSKLTATDASAGDLFGSSVSLNSDTALIAAFLDSDAGIGSGSAYIFERNQGGMDNWGQVTKLVANDATEYDYFGRSVSIFDDTALVGSAGDSDGGTNSGSAYIFERDQGGVNNWGQVAKLTAGDATAYDYFGLSVSLYNNKALVGAPQEAGNTQGAVFIFERNQGGSGAWGQVDEFNADDTMTDDYFGCAVSLSGNIVVVGALLDDDGGTDSGSAYIFNLIPNNAPLAVDDTYTIPEDIPLHIVASGVLTNDLDIDGDLLIASFLTAPTNGLLNFNSDGSFVYTSTFNFNGIDTFSYLASDGVLTDTAVVTITVESVNDAPTAVDDSYTIDESSSDNLLSVLANDGDIDGDSLTIVSVSGVGMGTAVISGTTILYTPNPDFVGTDTFTYTMSDGELMDTATVTIEVTAVEKIIYLPFATKP